MQTIQGREILISRVTMILSKGVNGTLTAQSASSRGSLVQQRRGGRGETDGKQKTSPEKRERTSKHVTL